MAKEMDTELTRKARPDVIMVPCTNSKLGWKYIDGKKYNERKIASQNRIPGGKPVLGNAALTTLKSNIHQNKKFNYNKDELKNIRALINNGKETISIQDQTIDADKSKGNFTSTYEVSKTEQNSNRASPKQNVDLYRYIKENRGMASSISVNDMKGRRENAAKLLNKRAEDLRTSADSRIV